MTMNANELVNNLIEAKEVVSFGKAATMLCLIEEGKNFRGSDCAKVVAAFEEAKTGASALLVDQNGKYATRTETEGHPAFLKALGYTEIPAYKAKKVKGKGKAANAALVEALVSGLTAEQRLDMLKSLL